MVVLCITIVSIVLIYWIFFRAQRLKIPGPRGWPLVGCIFQIDPLRYHLTLTEWANKYGPVVGINFFKDTIVVVNSYDAIRDVLVQRGEVFGGRPSLYRSQLVSGYHDILNSSSDMPHWNVLRKVTHRYVKVLSVGTDDLEKRINNTIDISMKRLAEHNGKPVDMEQELHTFALATMFFLVFGEVINENNDEFQMMLEADKKILPELSIVGKGLLLDQFPWLRFFGNETYKNVTDGLSILWNLWEMKRSKVFHTEDKPVDCILQAMAEMRDNYKNDHNEPFFNDLHFRGVMTDLLIAGRVTTTTSLQVLICLLLNFPEIKSKLKHEVDTVLGKDRRVKVADRANMPYTRAVILELLRYAFIVPLGVPHATLRDTQINGYWVPKDTLVMTNLWHLHHDDKFWGDPWSYRPERFLNEAGQLVLPDHPNRRHLFPFGAGKRGCVGELFALNRMFLYIVTFMQKFNLLPAEKGKLPLYDPRTYITEFTIRPQDYKVRLIAN